MPGKRSLSEGKQLRRTVAKDKRKQQKLQKYNANKRADHTQDAHYQLPQYKRTKMVQGTALPSKYDVDNMDDMYEDSDVFLQQKQHIPLDAYQTAADDDEVEGREDDIDGLSGKNHIIDMDDEDESEAEEEEYDEADNERQQQIEFEESTLKGWGTTKSGKQAMNNYYGTDSYEYELLETAEDEEMLKDEEAEALRLQRERLQAMEAAEDENADESELTLLTRLNRQKNQPSTSKPAAVNGNDDSNERDVLASFATELDAIDALYGTSALVDEDNLKGDNDDIETHQIQRAAPQTADSASAELSAEDRLQLLIKNSPELFTLIEELQQRLQELDQLEKSQMWNIISIADNDSDPAITNYLNTQHTLLTQYTTVVTFYLSLRASGELTTDHQIFAQIVKLRALLQDVDDMQVMMQKKINRELKRLTEMQNEVKTTVKKQRAGISVAQNGTHTDDQPKTVKKRKLATATIPGVPNAQIELPPLPILSNKSKTTSNPTTTIHAYGDALIDTTNTAKPTLTPAERKAMLLAKQQQQQESEASMLDIDDMDEDELEEARNRYHQTKAEKQAAKLVRQQEFEARKTDQKAQKAMQRAERAPKTFVAPDRRAATKMIMLNKGLTRSRPKDHKTPRLRNRLRYEKGMAKHRSRVREFTEARGQAYGGEHTGIKRSTVKSTKL